MNKVELLKRLLNGSRGNMFSLEIPTTKEDEKKIQELVRVLETEQKIKLREYVQREYSVYLHGIIKYASDNRMLIFIGDKQHKKSGCFKLFHKLR